MSSWPEKLEDEVFGLLEFESKFGRYVGRAQLNPGAQVRVTLSVNTADELGVFRKQARQQFSELNRKLPEIYQRVRNEFLALYNEDWAGGLNGLGQPTGHGVITAGQFDEFVYLKDMHFSSDGTIDLWFHDGDELFAGHIILVTLDAALDITSTGLEG